MENISPDLLQFLVLDFDLESIANLCRTSKRMNTLICNNPNFWRNKMYKEYPTTRGKFPSDSDFRKIYLSLVNRKEEKYYTFISYNNDNQPPKFWNYIKKSPLSDEDFELATILFPDFEERQGEDFEFEIVGEYPIGTKIWLVYSTDTYDSGKAAFLSREEAIDRVLKVVKSNLKVYFDDEVEFDGKSAKDFYGGTLDEVMEKYKNDLIKNNYLQINMDDTVKYVIKDFEIVDYKKMLNELKRINPNWRKLPKDLINEILKYLQ